jgi:hypothetical protein
MPEPKTRKTTASVKDFIAAVPDEQRRKDATAVMKMLAEVTGEKAAMWGPSIVGFGSYQGPTGQWPIASFSPRKANLVVYIAPEFPDRDRLLGRLGPHSVGKSCLYLKRLSEVDVKVLRQIVEKSVAGTRKRYNDR